MYFAVPGHMLAERVFRFQSSPPDRKAVWQRAARVQAGVAQRSETEYKNKILAPIFTAISPPAALSAFLWVE